jgi:hypothetical protein
MKILSLTLAGYRQFLKRTMLEMPVGLTGICGPNGVGKSKLIEAIGFALYGPNTHLLPHGDRAADIPSKGQEGAQPSVELVLEIRGQQYRLTRTAKAASLYLEGAADALAQTPSGVTQKMIELLRLPPAAYYATFVARQNELARLQNLPTAQRRKLVNRLIGVAIVEKALELVEDVYAQRQEESKQEASKLQYTVDQVEQELQVRREALAVAVAKEAELLNALDQARADTKVAQATWSIFERHQNKIVALEREQHLESERRISLTKTLTSTQTRVRAAESAGAGVQKAEQTLRETAEVPASLEQMVALSRVHELRDERARYQRQLESEVLPVVQQCQDLEALTADIDAILETLKAQATNIRQRLALALQAAEREQREAERHERQQEQAELLGASGVCETCGQSFGDNLAQAIAHYQAAAEEARGREQQTRTDITELNSQLVSEEANIEQHEIDRRNNQKLLREARPVLDQRSHIEHAMATIEKELAQFPLLVREGSYDQARHQVLLLDKRRREEALADRERLQAIADTVSREREEEQRLISELAQLDERVAQCQEQIVGLRTQLAEQDSAAVARDAALLREKKAADEHSEAGRNAAAAQALVWEAEARLQATSAQAQRLAEAERSRRVAERTRDTLRQLLEEITAEARPRITELLELWAGPMLGPRFRRIELTEDYRIRADNGSGLHDIEHFSGGEQTLLALMLRVAISLFCQERAGFDTGFLILDEIFGNQDSRRRGQLVQFLTEIKEHYHQIVIVNHIEDVTGMLDSIIAVEPTGPNTSTATVSR